MGNPHPSFQYLRTGGRTFVNSVFDWFCSQTIISEVLLFGAVNFFMRPNWSFVLELLEKFTAHTKTVACRQSLIAKIFLFLRVLDLCCIHLLISQKSYPAPHCLPMFKSLHHNCSNFSPDKTVGGPIRINATGLGSDSSFIPDQNLKSLVLDSIKS